MRSYKGFFKMTFKGEIQYRAKALSGVATQFFWGIMYIYLYTAFMGGSIIDGFSISQMASYIWLGQAFFMLRYVEVPKKYGAEIESGDVCYKFIRPVDLYNQWFFEHIGYKISATILRCWPIIIVSLLLPANMGLSLPASLLAFLLSLIALCLGALMTSAISMFILYLTLKTNSQKGTQAVISTISGVLGGMYIPLPLMPEAIQNILNFLPFRFISDLPIRIYIGNVSIQEALMFIGICVVWLVILISLGKLLITRALKKAQVQGG